MDEKIKIPPNNLLNRIQSSINSLRSTAYAHYYPLQISSSYNNFRQPSRTFPHFIRRKWSYITFGLIILIIVMVKIKFAREIDPFEETPALTGHSIPQQAQPQRPPPQFSTFTDNYPKKLAILILPSSNSSIGTYNKAIVETWGKIAKKNKSLSVDLWFATSEDTLKNFGWPNVPVFTSKENVIDKTSNDKKSGLNDLENSTEENKIPQKKDDLKEMMRELLEQTMVFKEPYELNEMQKEFKNLTKALHFLYEYHLDHYDYFLKISDKTFVQLPRLLNLLSNYKPPFKPRLIGHPDVDFDTNKKFCWKGPGYIMNKYLLAIIGPHLPFCLEDDETMTEDLALERCLNKYVPSFNGCESLINGTGYEFLYIRPDDDASWENMVNPERQFDDGNTNGQTFADAITIGEVDEIHKLKDLEKLYGIGGKYEPLIEKLMKKRIKLSKGVPFGHPIKNDDDLKAKKLAHAPTASPSIATMTSSTSKVLAAVETLTTESFKIMDEDDNDFKVDQTIEDTITEAEENIVTVETINDVTPVTEPEPGLVTILDDAIANDVVSNEVAEETTTTIPYETMDDNDVVDYIDPNF
ncbi:13085_t:CDS:2 [Entrophospora sp. SA101]|nr:13110_t:CDS:2 [Entrophospora sp. SA101]CAJ0631310.1 13591_t:CDS:2 [Entrophospora sp. SA101]CAJ0631331.1 13605_t:CDS:2 [Entrophospora sp. SA101]CAJ0749019.1 13085_t:CDS:2 [Entrophospora sp. SA101]CAJ0831647.1 1786_t:CDS:2 [Entrophospora sp. SA101]